MRFALVCTNCDPWLCTVVSLLAYSIAERLEDYMTLEVRQPACFESHDWNSKLLYTCQVRLLIQCYIFKTEIYTNKVNQNFTLNQTMSGYSNLLSTLYYLLLQAYFMLIPKVFTFFFTVPFTTRSTGNTFESFFQLKKISFSRLWHSMTQRIVNFVCIEIFDGSTLRTATFYLLLPITERSWSLGGAWKLLQSKG